jgi:hypothetical protein
MTAPLVAGTPLFGVNLPWLDGAYGHDLAPSELRPTWPCDFATLRAYLPLVQAADLGFSAVRVWLCENGEGIITEDGRPARPHPQLMEGVRVLQECARLLGLRVYWTLLDGNSWKREGDSLTHAILTDADACARFAECVAAPLVRQLDPAVTYGVEVINEPEALSPSCVHEGESVPWQVLGRSIRFIGDAVRAALPGVMVTTGTYHVYLPQLWQTEPRLDAVDVHVYHRTGGLPSREELAAASGDRRIADGSLLLIAGECGITDAPEEPALTYYLYNAKKLGYSAAFLWRLEGPLVDDTAQPRRITNLGNTVAAIMEQLRGAP